jgi:D-alanine-D-alanine ligase
MKKKKIAVLLGGLSAEREVSVSSGKSVVKALKDMKYDVVEVDVGRDVAAVLASVNPDVVFNALHGEYGEDGKIQGLLDMMGIPYTHSGVMASSICMHKHISKQLFVANGILMPKSELLTEKQVETAKIPKAVMELMQKPYVIKPLNQGSSFGVQIVKEPKKFTINNYHFEYGKTVLVEQYIAGREINVAIIDGKAIGTLEIKMKEGFFDYKAKYTEGLAEKIIPADLSDAQTKQVLEIAEQTNKIVGARGVGRPEFIFDGKDFYLIEFNTHPGFTPISLVPKIAAYKNISFNQLIESLINGATYN